MEQHDADVVEAIAKLNRQWMKAYTSHDTAFLERYIADDYVGTFPDGTVHDKKSEIESMAAIAITKMEPREMTVRVYGDAAVITGHSSIRARVNDQDMSAELRFTDVWIKRENQWQAVASQVTHIV